MSENKQNKTYDNTRAKVIININKDNEKIYNTKFDDVDDSNHINAYWGCVQAYQSGSNYGKTKKYFNDNGILKIESSTWKYPNLKQTPENRRNPENWDESRKYFEICEINLQKIEKLSKLDRLDNKPKGTIIITFEGKRHNLLPGQYVEFGSIDKKQIKIY